MLEIRFMWESTMNRLITYTFLLALSGCSMTLTDPDGNVRVIGFVDMTIQPPANNTAGEIVRIQTLGLSGVAVHDSMSVTLGYSDLHFSSFKDNILAIGPFLLE